MNESWDELVQMSLREMEQKQQALPLPDPAGQWNADQDTGTFTEMDSKGQVTVIARFQFVGTYSTTTHSCVSR
jgi:hypothetical protein